MSSLYLGRMKVTAKLGVDELMPYTQATSASQLEIKQTILQTKFIIADLFWITAVIANNASNHAKRMTSLDDELFRSADAFADFIRTNEQAKKVTGMIGFIRSCQKIIEYTRPQNDIHDVVLLNVMSKILSAASTNYTEKILRESK